ncbi:MAG: ferritin [Spirochaetes bacterium]|nr:ferritin [Spirochaetota bacterium]
MMTDRIFNELNRQVNEEFYSAYLYLSIVSYFESINLQGFAHWMKAQVQEEIMHAMKFFNYLVERGKKPELLEIKKPETKFESILDAFEKALKHEKYITSRIWELVKISEDEKDYATLDFLKWYVKEQVEEELSVDTILQKLKMISNSNSGLLYLDKEMGKREYPQNIFDKGYID